ncbi:hypothetical protein AVV27_gp21 [Achromobacter phage 83-24]|uniref:Uncharacterized protein n=1 Tax=Achromobacter phage 83-24 TaxID=1589747 RepID=A0A0B5A4F6_9CAUD|nr:hypothetical protein AVV27_gp21 [Achromobacter phage 83-24]AJD82854.1 hypothetical protein JWAP_00021 [Achromobacter phage 83-24]
MLKSGIIWTGEVHFELNGRLFYKKNMIVDAGLNFASDSIFLAATTGKLSFIGLGSGTTAPAAGQTALVTPIPLASGGTVFRKAFDAAPTRAGAVTTVNTTFAPGEATGNINEAGLFTAVSGGVMFSRVKTDVTIPKDANAELRVRWILTAARG